MCACCSYIRSASNHSFIHPMIQPAFPEAASVGEDDESVVVANRSPENRHTPPVLSLSIRSPITRASWSKIGHPPGKRLKNRRCHSRPSACSFFLSSRCAFSILLFSMPTWSMSDFLMAAATCCQARLDSWGPC